MRRSATSRVPCRLLSGQPSLSAWLEPVREGEEVEQGQVLARLDPTDFRITLEDRQATFDNAERNFTRAQELIKDGNISKLDYDRMEADFRSAR